MECTKKFGTLKSSDTTHVTPPNMECGKCFSFPETSDAWNVIHWNVNNNSCPLDSLLIELFCSRSVITSLLKGVRRGLSLPNVTYLFLRPLLTYLTQGFLPNDKSWFGLPRSKWFWGGSVIPSPFTLGRNQWHKTDCNSLFIFSCLLCEIDLCVRVVPCLVWDHSYCLLATYFEHSKCRLLLCGYYASSGLQLLEFHQIAVVLQIQQFDYLYYREKEIKLTGPMFDFVPPKLLDSWQNAVESWFKI